MSGRPFKIGYYNMVGALTILTLAISGMYALPRGLENLVTGLESERRDSWEEEDMLKKSWGWGFERFSQFRGRSLSGSQDLKGRDAMEAEWKAAHAAASNGQLR